jgi:hypothetical protein
MPRTYPTEEAAFRRADVLRQQGIWPGVRACDGGWELTWDPEREAEGSEPR